MAQRDWRARFVAVGASPPTKIARRSPRIAPPARDKPLFFSQLSLSLSLSLSLGSSRMDIFVKKKNYIFS